MTVSSAVNRNDYAGNGSTTNFAVSFRFLQNSDVKATLRDALSTETLQVETTDYTLTGAGGAGGGTLVMIVAPPSGTTLTIQRDVPATQETDYVENDEFPAESHEDALDKLTMLVQQQGEDSTRHIGFSDTVSDATGSAVELSQDATQRADTFLGFDALGNIVTKTASVAGLVDQGQQDKRYGTIFATVAAMTAANPVSLDGVVVVPSVGMTLYTQGKDTSDDEEGGVFIVKAAAGITADDDRDLTLDGGLIAVRQDDAVKQLPEVGRLTPGLAKNIACGIDSLTAGASSTTYLDFFIPSVRAHLGSEGLGYQAFDLGSATFWGSGFNRTGSADIAITDAFGKKAFDGKGQLVAAGVGTENFSWNPITKWTTARIYYLQSATGGTFKIRRANQASGDSVLVDTSGADAIGSVDVEYAGTGQQAIVMDTITGEVCIFGGDFQLAGAEGGTINLMAAGGRTLEEVALQDATFYQNWITTLAIDTFVLNSGTNDRITRTAAQYEADYRTLIGRIQTAKSDAQVMLVTGNSPADSATTNKNEFAAKDVALALEFGFAYYDVRDALGSYQNAVDNSWMLDTIHPNLAANKIINRAICDSIGFPSNGLYEGEPGFPEATGSNIERSFTLSEKSEDAAAAAVATELWDLGLVNGFPTAIVEIEIVANRNGTNAQTKKTHRVGIQNGATLNNVSGIDTVDTDLEYQQAAGDAGVMDWAFSATIVDSRMLIEITPTTYAMNYLATGVVEFSRVTVAGTSVFEN